MCLKKSNRGTRRTPPSGTPTARYPRTHFHGARRLCRSHGVQFRRKARRTPVIKQQYGSYCTLWLLAPPVRRMPAGAVCRRRYEERQARPTSGPAGHMITQMGNTLDPYVGAHYLALCIPEPVGCRTLAPPPPLCGLVVSRMRRGGLSGEKASVKSMSW